MKIDANAMQRNAKQASQLLGAMANEKRLMILCHLLNGEHSVGELAEFLGTRPSTVSQHLTLLRKDGLVESRREAQTQIYSLVGDAGRRVLQVVYALYCAPDPVKARRKASMRS